MFKTTGVAGEFNWLASLFNFVLLYPNLHNSRTVLMIFLNSFMIRKKKMKIEFKNVATVADLKAFEKAEIPDEAKIVVHYDYDLTSSEDTQVVRDTIASPNGS